MATAATRTTRKDNVRVTPLLSVKYIDRYDWIGLKIKQANGENISMTWSRYRDKISGDVKVLSEAEWDKVYKKFGNLRDEVQVASRFETLGDAMKHIQQIAEKCSTLSEFVNKEW